MRKARPMLHRRSEMGAYTVLMSIFFLVVFMVGMMAFEVGHLMRTKTHIQSVADLAALAAVRHYAATEKSQDARGKWNGASFESAYQVAQAVVNKNYHYPYREKQTAPVKLYSFNRNQFFFGKYKAAPALSPDFDFEDDITNDLKLRPNEPVRSVRPAGQNINAVKVVLKADQAFGGGMLKWLHLDVTKISAESIAQRCSETVVKLYGECPCGNGQPNRGEACDDGNSNGVVCTPNPPVPAYKHNPPPNESSCEWCNEECGTQTVIARGPFCGDSVKQSGQGEDCDGLDSTSGKTCRTDCCFEGRHWTDQGCRDDFCDAVIDSSTECDPASDPHCNKETCLCEPDYELQSGICQPRQIECNNNGQRDNGEAGVDCGGGGCPPCQSDCPNAVEFKSPGNFEWQAPADIVSVEARIWGAGGGGGAGRKRGGNVEGGTSHGIGGGGGGYAQKEWSIQPGTRLKVIVGKGGDTGLSEAELFKAEGGESSEVRNNSNGVIAGAGGGGGGGRILINEALTGFDFLNYLFTAQPIGKDGYGMMQSLGGKGAGKGAWKDKSQDGFIRTLGATGGSGYFTDANQALSLAGEASQPSGWSKDYPLASAGGNSARGGAGGKRGRCGPDGSGDACTPNNLAGHGEFPGGGGGGSETGSGGSGADGQVILCPVFNNLSGECGPLPASAVKCPKSAVPASGTQQYFLVGGLTDCHEAGATCEAYCDEAQHWVVVGGRCVCDSSNGWQMNPSTGLCEREDCLVRAGACLSYVGEPDAIGETSEHDCQVSFAMSKGNTSESDLYTNQAFKPFADSMCGAGNWTIPSPKQFICKTPYDRGFALTEGACKLCGDGRREANFGEQCDDGNRTNGDGCSNTCLCDGELVYQNGKCEPKKSAITAECFTSPSLAKLREKVTWTVQVSEGSDADYFFSWQGDRAGQSAKTVTAPGGYASPGVYTSTVKIFRKPAMELVATSSPCSVAVADLCGNGSLDAGEECDDGNKAGNDGCSSACKCDGGLEYDAAQKKCLEKTFTGECCRKEKYFNPGNRQWSGWDLICTTEIIDECRGCDTVGGGDCNDCIPTTFAALARRQCGGADKVKKINISTLCYECQ